MCYGIVVEARKLGDSEKSNWCNDEDVENMAVWFPPDQVILQPCCAPN